MGQPILLWRNPRTAIDFSLAVRVYVAPPPLQAKGRPMQLISTYLEQLKLQLQTNKISSSDAILGALRVCRRLLPEEQLICLTRELLGYTSKDAEDIKVRLAAADFPVVKKRPQLDSCIHRILPGYRLEVGQDQLGLMFIGEPKSTAFFCEMGMVEIEELISDSLCQGHNYSAIDFDEGTNTVFICKTTSLVNLQEAVKRKICLFLDTLIKDLRVPDSQNTRTWSKQPLS